MRSQAGEEVEVKHLGLNIYLKVKFVVEEWKEGSLTTVLREVKGSTRTLGDGQCSGAVGSSRPSHKGNHSTV